MENHLGMSITMSEQIGEIASALAIAQGKIETAVKNKTNPHFKSSYADLTALREVYRYPLAENGLSIIQSPSCDDQFKLHLTTILLHKSGQYIKGELKVNVGDARIQTLGSSITYARRYAINAILGLTSDEEDDGETEQEHSANSDQKKDHSEKKAQKDPGRLYTIPFYSFKGRVLSEEKNIPEAKRMSGDDAQAALDELNAKADEELRKNPNFVMPPQFAQMGRELERYLGLQRD